MCRITHMLLGIVVLLAMLGLVSGFRQHQEPTSAVGKVARILPSWLKNCVTEASCLLWGDTSIDTCIFYIMRCILGTVWRLNACVFDIVADMGFNFLKHGFHLSEHDWWQYISDITSNCLGFDLDYFVSTVRCLYGEKRKYLN